MADTDYIGKDKVKHLCVCLVAAIIHPWLAVGLALGKEYGDSRSNGNHFCIWDLVADGVGTALGSLAWLYIW